MNPREKDLGAKKEADLDYIKFPRITSSSSRHWSNFKNPRIVRASRAFGGKDRHSKVCTIRGLKDRRIRLSVPTAIQLYDLQDRLGLSQPSNVVDWLLDATKHEINKLPPLPIVPTNFAQFHQPTSASQESSAFCLSDLLTVNEAYAKGLGINQSKELRIKMTGKEIMIEKNKWPIASQHQQENEEGFGGFVAQLSAQNFFPLSSQFSEPNMPYNSSYFHCDLPNLPLFQFGGGYTFSTQMEEQSQCSVSSTLPSTSQPYMCTYATTLPSITPPFPSYIPTPLENDHLRQISHLQNVQQNSVLPTTLHLISSPVKSFSLNVNSKTVNSLENDN